MKIKFLMKKGNGRLFKEDGELFVKKEFKNLSEATLYLIVDSQERGYHFVRDPQNETMWIIFEDLPREVREVYSFRCLPSVFNQFKNACEKRGISIGYALENYMKQFS